ncbi:MAG: pilus assembly protein [Brevundimonas sp.]|nr:MAG: pilus assembly protein [Brevundimonas sp.]
MLRTSKLRRRLVRNQDGSAAVEFALVALPFCFMIFAILELGLVFVLDSVLENATIETGRLVRTGQAQASSMDAAGFKSALCDRMSIFAGPCSTQVQVDVREMPDFATVAPDPMQAGSFNSALLTYGNGSAGSLMLVRVWYRHPLMTTFLSQGLSRMDDGTAMLTATTAFRNEP